MELKWEQLRCGTRTAKIAGGTLLHIPADTIEAGDGCGRSWAVETYPGGAVFVPDPPAMAELGTFDPPADDRPPMTDDELRAWLTATHGEPGYKDRDVMTWPEVFQRPHFDFLSAVTMETLNGAKYWHFNDGQQWLPPISPAPPSTPRTATAPHDQKNRHRVSNYSLTGESDGYTVRLQGERWRSPVPTETPMKTARNIEILWTRNNRHQITADGTVTGLTARIVKIGANHGCAAEIRNGRKVLVKADVDRMVSHANHEAAIMLALDTITI